MNGEDGMIKKNNHVYFTLREAIKKYHLSDVEVEKIKNIVRNDERSSLIYILGPHLSQYHRRLWIMENSLVAFLENRPLKYEDLY